MANTPSYLILKLLITEKPISRLIWEHSTPLKFMEHVMNLDDDRVSRLQEVLDSAIDIELIYNNELYKLERNFIRALYESRGNGYNMTINGWDDFEIREDFSNSPGLYKVTDNCKKLGKRFRYISGLLDISFVIEGYSEFNEWYKICLTIYS